MKNYIKYLSTVLMIIGTCTSMWATVPTTAELNFGTPGVSADFEGVSVVSMPNDSKSAISGSLSGYGPFTAYYIGKNDNGIQSIAIVDGSSDNEDPMTSKYFAITTSNNGASVTFSRTGPATFATKGAYYFKITKSSKLSIGLYNGEANGSISHANAAAFLRFNGSTIAISAGRNSGTPKNWEQVVSSSLPSGDIIEIAVVYNTTEEIAEYGDGIALAANSAHVYINGTAADDGEGKAKDFYIGGNTIAHFRLYDNSTGDIRTSCVDDIKIYDALPTAAGSEITLSKNNSDLSGSTDGIGRILADATSMTITTAPTRVGYEVEGYYTTSATTTKIATDEGELQASITVGVNVWTDGSNHWKHDADETFYTKWTPKTYTVTLNKQSGTGGSDEVSATYAAAMPSATMPTRSGYNFEGYFTGTGGAGTKYYNADGSSANNWNEAANTTLYAHWSAKSYTDYRFSCAELTLTVKPATAGTPIFITSTAGKTVRSQDTIQITGNGLTPSTTLTFPGLPSKFAIKKANGTELATDGSGEIDENAFIFYTPDAEDTSDGLDKLIGITASVGGAKPKIDTLRHDIIGRHLPADFVIAGKKNNKWYALPANFTDEQTPAPAEIAVNDIDNPAIAYTANTNIYNLYGQNSGASGYLYYDGDSDGKPDGDKIKLGMKNKSNYPLFAFASPKNSLKGDDGAIVTNNINKQYWWTLKQINASITNPQDAVYIINSSNNSGTLSIKNSPFVWGTYASGVEELRLIPASSVVFAEAEIVEWGKNGAVVEVDATAITATKAKAKLGAAESSVVDISQTLTCGGNEGATKYNYTINFGSDIDFSASSSYGAMLVIEWYNSSSVIVGVSNIIVPKIVASDITINKTNYPNKGDWNVEVHVLPGDTLKVNADYTPNADVTIKELNIYPGATVIVTGGTLKPTTLVLRNGWKCIGGKSYDVARLYIDGSASMSKPTNTYMDWYIDFDHYYPIAVPWEVDLGSNDGSKLTYLNTNSKAIIGEGSGTSVRLRYYDGKSRAENGQTGVGNSANWKLYGGAGNRAVPAKLQPSKGYAMTAKRPTGKAFSIIRMPLTIPSADWTSSGEKGEVSPTHKDTVYVSAWGAGQDIPTYTKGWNFIANPYMSFYKGTIEYASGTKVNHVNIPDVDFKEFGQYATATTKLAPASAFLIQAPETGAVTFGTANRAASAPSYRNQATEVIPEQQAYILLSQGAKEDMMGIFVSEKYTADYDLNGDLEKLLSDGNTLRAWMNYINMNLAYVAVNEELAKEWIPVSVRIPETGEYTFRMHEASIADELEGVYLIDYQTDVTTNLMYDSYTFTAEAGTNTERFAINAIVGERKVPTSMDVTGGDVNGNEPVKFIWHDKVYILHNNVIYDSTGKRVNVINK